MTAERGSCGGGISLRLVFGLLLLAAGSIFLADNLGLVDGDLWLHRLWPAGFAAIGVAVLLQPGSARGRWWGVVWLVAGAWIWADQEGWVDVDFWDVFFPAALLVVGGSLVWRAFAGPGRADAAGVAESDAWVRAFAVMAGNERRSVSTALRGGDLTAFMGGVTLDLRQARVEGGEAVIDAIAFWGGIEIRVPEDWVVISRVIPLMGGFEDKTRPPAPTAERAPTAAPSPRLVVRGVAIMGGIEVKN
jgi:hypothetical protein